MRDRIPVSKGLIPYTFNIAMADSVYALTLDYNYTGDFFTIALASADGTVLSRGEKLVYGNVLWQDIYDNRTFPCLTIKPVDPGGYGQRITWYNFGSTVFLEIFDTADEE